MRNVLERVINPQRGGMSPEWAKEVLAFDLSPADHARYEELAYKAQDGALTPQERAELDEFVNTNDLLTILKSKARVSLRQGNSAA